VTKKHKINDNLTKMKLEYKLFQNIKNLSLNTKITLVGKIIPLTEVS